MRPGRRSRCSSSTTTRSSAGASRDLLEAEPDIDGGRRGRHRRVGPGPDPGAAAGRRRPRRAAARRRRGRRCAGRSAPRMPEVGLPDAHLVRRRRGAVRRDHGRRGRVRAQADPRHRPGRRGPHGRRRAVAAGPARRPSAVLERLRQRRRRADPLAGAHRAGAPDPRADRRGADQPADRRADVPGREDREELRVRAARQAGHGAPHPGGRLRGPRVRRPARHRPRALPGSRN